MAMIFSINAFLVLPVVRMLTNNVIYSDSVFIVAIEYIAEIIEVAAISVCYALMLSALYMGRSVRGAFVIFASLTAYKNLGFDIADYPRAYAHYEREVTLPLHTLLSDDDVKYITDALAELLAK